MLKHSFTYTIIEDYIDVDPESKKVIKKIILKDDEKIPGMNQTSFYDINESLNKLVIKKLGPLLKFVWFIEGDKNSSPLSFYDVGYPYVDINTPKDFEFVPGTLLLFPGYMPHEVRPNKNNNRLVVSGNLV